MDSGNLASKALTLEITTDIMSNLGYDAVGVGGMDLRVGDEFFKQTAEHDLVVLDAAPDARDTTTRYIIKEIGGLKVGIVSFRGSRSSLSGQTDFKLRRALYSAFREARDASDVLILLDQANLVSADWLKRNGPRLGEPDIVIGGIGNKRLKEQQVVGRTHILPTSSQARDLGVADIEFTPGLQPRIVSRIIPLGNDVADDKQIAQRLSEHRLKLHKQTIASPRSKTSYITKPASGGTPYYSSRLCRVCHREQYQDWLNSGHARAMKTLVDAESVTPDCLPCHSESYRRLKEARVPKASDTSGVECATCHADALPHGMARRNVAKKTRVDPKLCLQCHDDEYSPDYDQETYFARISHPGTSTTASAIMRPK